MDQPPIPHPERNDARPIRNNLPDFCEQHPDCRGIIGLYLLAWKEVYGDDIICDIATSKAESKAKYEAYTAAGYVFKDENAFGCGSDTLGYISCYLPPENLKT